MGSVHLKHCLAPCAAAQSITEGMNSGTLLELDPANMIFMKMLICYLARKDILSECKQSGLTSQLCFLFYGY